MLSSPPLRAGISRWIKKNMQKVHASDQRFILFWIGVLTGAVIVGLIFTYQMIQNQALENAILKSTQLQTPYSNTLTSTDSTSVIGPGM
jgi:uncharacterized membrane protein YciS (DUF1049 family)